jgi:hypothetical protein
MPYVNIPETGLESSIARQIGKLKGEFQGRVQSTLASITEDLKDGCPSAQELESITNKLNSIKELSANIAERLNRISKLIPPLKTGSQAILTVVPILKALPIPGLALTAGVTSTFSDVLHLVKEFGTQLNTSATSIESLLTQASSLNELLKQAGDLSSRVDIILQFCGLADQAGIELPAECISIIATGTPAEAAQCIRDFNNLLGTNLEGEDNLKEQLSDDSGVELYTGPDGTVYGIRIIQVPSDFTRAPRRQAIAENPDGIKKFESDASFSSSVDVLKRQVKFRIDNSQV